MHRVLRSRRVSFPFMPMQSKLQSFEDFLPHHASRVSGKQVAWRAGQFVLRHLRLWVLLIHTSLDHAVWR